MANDLSTNEARALELLGSGIEPVQVASALGISESRISQLIADPEFAGKLAEAKYKNLAKHNETDNLYDRVEKKALEQLERSLPMIMRPMELTRVVATLNSAKRRGISSPDAITRVKPTVKLSIPIAVVNKFQVNAANQVVQAGTSDGNVQDLVTIQSSNVRSMLNDKLKAIANNPSPTLTEADGVKWTKRQGREQNLLEDLGFTVELEIASPGTGNSASSE